MSTSLVPIQITSPMGSTRPSIASVPTSNAGAAPTPAPSTSLASTLPSIRSLRSKFQTLASGGKKRAGPKVIRDGELMPAPPRAGGLARFGSLGGGGGGGGGGGVPAKRRASEMDLKIRSLDIEAARQRPSLDGLGPSVAGDESDILDIRAATTTRSPNSSITSLPSTPTTPPVSNNLSSASLASSSIPPGRPPLSNLRLIPRSTGSLLRKSPTSSRLAISSPLLPPAESPVEEDVVLEIRTPPKPLWPSIQMPPLPPTVEQPERKDDSEYRRRVSITGEGKLVSLVDVHEKKISDNQPSERLSPNGITSMLPAATKRVAKKSSTGILDFYATTPPSSTNSFPHTIPDLPKSPLLQHYTAISPARSDSTVKGSDSPLSVQGEDLKVAPESTTAEIDRGYNSTSSSASIPVANGNSNHVSIESAASSTEFPVRPSSTNTFGDPLEEAEAGFSPATLLSPTSEGGMPPTPLSIVSTHDFIPPRLNELRRAKSSLDKGRSLGDDDSIGRGVSTSPSRKEEEKTNSALYRSASARPATRTLVIRPARSSLQVRRVGSTPWERKSSEPGEVGGEFGAIREGGTTAEEDGSEQVHLASPLDRLISGLGGKIQPARTNSGAGRPDSMEVGASPVIDTNATWHEKDDLNKDASVRTLHALTISESETSPTSLTNGLSVEEMEREIARMEAELALVGLDPRSHPSLQSTFEAPTPTSYSPAPGESPRATRLVDLWTTSERDSSTTGHDSLSSSLDANTEITPRTAKRWSIVDVEESYERMKAILGSTRSLAAMSDSGTFHEEREGEVSDVEGASEVVVETLGLAQADGAELEETEDVFSMSSSQVDTARPKEFETSPSPRSLPGSAESRPMALSTSTSSSVLTSSPGRRRTHSSPDTSPPTPERILKPRSSSSLIGSPPPSRSLLISPGRAERAHRDAISPVAERSRQRLSMVRPLSRLGSERATSAMSGLTEETRDGWATPLTSPGSRVGLSRASSRLSATTSTKTTRESTARISEYDSPRRYGSVREGASTPDEYSDYAKERHRRRSSLDVRSRSSMDFRTKADETVRLPRSSSRLSQSYSRDAPPPSSDFATRRLLKPSSETWFPSTPDRSAHRVKGVPPRFSLRESDMEGRRPLSSSVDMAAIRGMDKLEIFFKYAAMKADLEKAEMERDALMDALQETRAILDDVRAQRDTLERQLRDGKSSSRQVERILGTNSEVQGDRLQELVRSRQMWETRATDALDEVDHVRDEMESLRILVIEGRAREEQLERELIHSSGYTTGTTGRSDKGHQTTDSVGFSSSNPPFSDDDDASIHDAIIASASTFTLPGSNSPNVSPDKSFTRNTLPRSPSRSPRHRLPFPTSSVTPAMPSSPMVVPEQSRDRYSPLFSPVAGPPLADFLEETPLLEQRAIFGAKSSFGSVESPLKPRAKGNGRLGSLGRTGLPKPSRLSINPPPPPALQPITLTSSAGKRMSAVSSNSSENHGDHLPLPQERDWNPVVGTDMPELDQRDELFLSDLSGTIG